QLLALYGSGRVERGIGLDLAEKMLALGRDKIKAAGLTDRLTLQHGSAEAIPFDDNSFDAVSITFGIRNVTDVTRTLAEMYRVLKPGGRAMILEFSLPESGLLRGPYLFYLRHVLPHLGRLFSGDNSAYRYLNRTIETFPYGEAFCRLMREVGFAHTVANPQTFGVATIYVGDKP
ncbi:MAG: ubiquinone/menaquinone biosynthesis methyltransferase, partial [Candidatus Zixiibacteriota bacterium]